MEANQEQLAYAIWLDRELERSVKQLAKRAAHNDVRNAHEYRVRATQDAIRQLNGQHLFSYRAEKVKDVLYNEMLAGQIRPALYSKLVDMLEVEKTGRC